MTDQSAKGTGFGFLQGQQGTVYVAWIYAQADCACVQNAAM